MFRLPLTRVRSSGGTFAQVVLASASISFQRFCAACSLAMELALICLLVRGGAGATARVLSADSGRFMVNSLFFVMHRRGRRNCRTPLPVAAETRNPIGHAPEMATPQRGPGGYTITEDVRSGGSSDIYHRTGRASVRK